VPGGPSTSTAAAAADVFLAAGPAGRVPQTRLT